MGALAHYLETDGIPTTQVSLVREHTEALVPPRALWVPFILGRPFGVPNDATFQRGVLMAALNLLERDSGPVLEDYPLDAPAGVLTESPEGLACPVSFPARFTEGSLVDRITGEVSQLLAWHDAAVAYRGRTTLGVTGLSPLQLGDYVIAWLEGKTPQRYRSDVTQGDALKQACDELKAFYYEAKSVQPGQHTSASVHDWFWFDTAAGEALVKIKHIAANSADPTVKAVSGMSLIPRAVESRLSSKIDGQSA